MKKIMMVFLMAMIVSCEKEEAQLLESLEGYWSTEPISNWKE